MPVEIRCACGKTFSVPDSRASKPVRCYMCGREVAAIPVNLSTNPLPVDAISDKPQVSIPTSAPPPLNVGFSKVDAFRIIADEMERGRPLSEIEQELRKQGFDPATAKAAVQEMAPVTTDELRQTALKNIILGLAICICGIVVTVGTMIASETTGGSYIIAYGAIVAGAFQFMLGMAQWGVYRR